MEEKLVATQNKKSLAIAVICLLTALILFAVYFTFIKQDMAETAEKTAKADRVMLEQINKAKRETGPCGELVYRVLKENNASIQEVLVVRGKAYAFGPAGDVEIQLSRNEGYKFAISGSISNLDPRSLEMSKIEDEQKICAQGFNHSSAVQ